MTMQYSDLVVPYISITPDPTSEFPLQQTCTCFSSTPSFLILMVEGVLNFTVNDMFELEDSEIMTLALELTMSYCTVPHLLKQF